jgi:hypothetical protein
MMSQLEPRNQKRKEFVDAIVIRKEPVVLASRVFSIPLRTAFNGLALYRSVLACLKRKIKARAS